MRKLTLLLSSLYLGVICLGCASGGGKEPRRYYLMEVSRPESPIGQVLPGYLLINPTRMSPGFDKMEFVYRLSPGQYEQDYYNQFIIGAGSQINQQMRSWLSRSRCFSEVLPAASTARASYVLESGITALYGDFQKKNQPKAVLQLEVFLIDIRAADAEVIFHHEYFTSVSIAQNTAEALINGYENCLIDVFTRLERDLQKITVKS